MKNNTLAKVVAALATRPKPKAPAIIATIRKTKLHPSIVLPLKHSSVKDKRIKARVYRA